MRRYIGRNRQTETETETDEKKGGMYEEVLRGNPEKCEKRKRFWKFGSARFAIEALDEYNSFEIPEEAK